VTAHGWRRTSPARAAAAAVRRLEYATPEYRQARAVELHSVPTTGGDEQKPSLSDCLKANGVPREQWATVSAAVAVWMRAWFHDVLDDDERTRTVQRETGFP
jgi:hypothetical protein